jgi:hypothetical protein
MGRDAGGGLVQHQHLGPGHQRAAHGDLLALAARQLARRLVALVLQDREQLVDLFHRPEMSSRMKAPISRFSSTVIEVKMFEVCGTKPMPLAHPRLRGQRGDVLAVEPHVARRAG